MRITVWLKFKDKGDSDYTTTALPHEIDQISIVDGQLILADIKTDRSVRYAIKPDRVFHLVDIGK